MRCEIYEILGAICQVGTGRKGSGHTVVYGKTLKLGQPIQKDRDRYRERLNEGETKSASSFL